MCISVSRGHLDGPCLVLSSYGEGCVETGLYCDAGVCRCRPDYFSKNDSCGETDVTSQRSQMWALYAIEVSFYLSVCLFVCRL